MSVDPDYLALSYLHIAIHTRIPKRAAENFQKFAEEIVKIGQKPEDYRLAGKPITPSIISAHVASLRNQQRQLYWGI